LLFLVFNWYGKGTKISVTAKMNLMILAVSVIFYCGSAKMEQEKFKKNQSKR